jgi:hypothetical protein
MILVLRILEVSVFRTGIYTSFAGSISHSSIPNYEVYEEGGALRVRTMHSIGEGVELTLDFVHIAQIRKLPNIIDYYSSIRVKP